MMSVMRPTLALARPCALRTGENFRDIVEPHMRQDEILRMGDARLIKGINFREIGDDAHLVGAGVAGRLRRWL